MRGFALISCIAVGGLLASASVASADAGPTSLSPPVQSLFANPLAAPSPDPNGDVTCTGVAPPVVPHDLIVPPGVICFMFQGTTVGHDVLVEPGGTLAEGGSTIGHDVRGDHPDVIELGDPFLGVTPGQVGHDVVVNGAQGLAGFFQEVCDTQISHDLVWHNTAASSAETSVGDRDAQCFSGASTVGHDGVFQNNMNPLEISDNNPANNGGSVGFGHNLQVHDNSGGTVVESNVVGHDCHQSNNHPYTNDDGDSTGPNVAGHDVDACNTPNP